MEQEADLRNFKLNFGNFGIDWIGVGMQQEERATTPDKIRKQTELLITVNVSSRVFHF